MQESKNLTKNKTTDKDTREMQDEALKTPGYSDDPHIKSSNRSPQNEQRDDEKGVSNES